ncbi:hypothetical protein K2173_017517 [Erythroxylum novogranatense]|uniref:Uncharacterized protein n=1 Tax=Erythroxylum novogranatense TaxID=1862640 RepID=A0AAV8TL67_9ROSI|nr:hypothetical protein K2173_017517 [Erythroxylum novogranatense]
MVSYGFEEIEDFYSAFSTRGVIGNVKIPVLFIQNDDGTVPPFSIPRSQIAGNPFTSLLFSCTQSSVNASDRVAESWCQNFTIEWLTAVELGLLKGRHPLLNDVDVTINPSKGLAVVEGRSSNQGGANKLLDLTPTDANANGYAMYPTKEMSSNSDTADRLHSRSKQDVQGNVEIGREMEEVDDYLTKDEGADPMDSERGEVLQTTRVVMNMLDISMPGCLTEEEKRKVLTAVGQGETLMKALQDAVPGDVREKLTTAASGILQAQQRNLKLEELLGFGKIHNASSGLKSKIQEEVGEVNVEGASKDPHSSDIAKRADELPIGSDDSQSGLEKSSDGLAPELHPSESKKKPLDSGPSYQSTGSQQVDASGSARKIANELGNISGTDDYSKEKTASCPDCADRGLDTSGKLNFTSSTGKANVTEEAIVDEKVGQDSGKTEIEIKKDFNTVKNEEKTLVSSTDQNKIVAGNMTEDAPSPMKSSSESQSMEKEGIDNNQKESRTSQPVLDQNKNVSDSSTPTFNVAQALDALAGVDDSTQVAVNSVFGVIENMISQLEEEKGDETDNKDESKVEDKTVDLPLKKRDISVLPPATAKQDSKNDLQIKSNALQDPPVCEQNENNSNSSRAACTGWLEEEPAADSSLLSADGTDGSLGIAANNHNGGGKEHDQLLGNNFLADHNDRHVGKIPLCVNALPYVDYIHNGYLGRYLLSKVTKTKPLDLDATTALLLDYFPEEGQWKLLEQPGSFEGSKGDAINHNRVGEKVYGHSSAKLNDLDNIIEPPFVMLDTEKHGTVGEYNTEETFDQALQYDDRLEELMQTVKSVILDALKVEAGRKPSTATMKEMKPNLDKDLEEVANAVSLATIHDKDHTWHLDGKNFSSNCTSEKIGTLNGEHILRAISSAVLGTRTSLAALRKFFVVATGHDNSIKSVGCENSGDETDKKYSARDIDQKLTKRTDPVIRLNATRIRDRKESELRTKNSDSVMVGAVTAALGASALLMQQQGQYNEKEIVAISSRPFKQNANTQKVADKVDQPISEKNQNNNLVTSLAEKAMSVAGPVVPTKEDGELDQERLVAILTDLGQRGGIMRLVGKVALLWGGMRGAMSLTDRLILFLRIAERPLYQRILGFVGMMLVLWSPVIVPLLPTLVQSWTTGSPSRFAELVSIFGLYTAVLILVVLWGKIIRGYEDPLAQYGLDLISPPKIHNFFKGFIGGTILVLSIQSVNAVVGCVSFSWPSILLSPSLGAMTSLKVFGRLTLLASRGIITASGVALVEELLFRSWLPEEIATNLGYHQGIIISGLVFSLLQGSLRAVPGLWLLSLALAGLRQRSKGNLAIPIGLRTGIMASSFVLQTGGFLSYNLNSPLWFTGTRPFQPFSGVVGLAFALFLAIILYPRKSFRKRKRLERIIRE